MASRVKLSRQFATLFIFVSFLLTLLIGHYVWLSWQDYRSASVLKAHFHLSKQLVAVIDALQYERLLSERYFHAEGETQQTRLLASELAQSQKKSQQLLNDLIEFDKADQRVSFFQFDAPALLSSLSTLQSFVMQSHSYHSSDLSSHQDLKHQELTPSALSDHDLLVQSYGQHIALFMTVWQHYDHQLGVFAELPYVHSLYGQMQLSEAIARLRIAGTEIVLKNQLLKTDQNALFANMARLEVFFNHYEYKEILQKYECWRKMYDIVQQLTLPDNPETVDVQEVFVSLANWSGLFNLTHRYVMDNVTDYIRRVDQQLETKIQVNFWELIMTITILLMVMVAFFVAYIRWVLNGFVRPFALLQANLSTVKQQVDHGRVQLIRFPEELCSQEIDGLISSTNQLLGHIKARDQHLQQHLRALEQMVESVIEVMTQVNAGHWNEKITLPADGVFALLKETINESIDKIHQVHLVSLHQERLSIMGSMAASMAHEINNPITGVLANLEYLALVTDNDEFKEVILESKEAMLRISKLVKSMLSFSRKSEDKNKPVCSFSLVLNDVLGMVKSLLYTADIRLNYDVARLTSVACQVSVDGTKLEQVLLNLITNAVQSMKNHVTIKDHLLTIDGYVLQEARQVLIRIADTGAGVPREVRDKIFDPFFTTKSQEEGTGLGLSICMKIVKEFGGMLVLDEDYQHGARFLLYLPLVDACDCSQREMTVMSQTARDELRSLLGEFAYQEVMRLLPQELSDLRQAFEQEDMEKAKYLAHKLKGGANAMGIVVIAGACAELENIAMNWHKQPQAEQVVSILQRLDLMVSALQNQDDQEKDIKIMTPPPSMRA